jgi:hypothetical protein
MSIDDGLVGDLGAAGVLPGQGTFADDGISSDGGIVCFTRHQQLLATTRGVG